MRTWGRSEISSYCFFVWDESSSLLRFKKTRGARGVCLNTQPFRQKKIKEFTVIYLYYHPSILISFNSESY